MSPAPSSPWEKFLWTPTLADTVCIYCYCRSAYQQNSLPGHPTYRQQCPALDAIVVGAEDAATDAEVGYFDGVLVSDETVPCRQVAMHHVQCLEVLHRRRYLSRHVDQAPVAVEQTAATLYN